MKVKALIFKQFLRLLIVPFMKFKLKAYSIWETGKRKDSAGNPHQEDSVFPSHGNMRDSDRLFVLCDGMGGHDAGEVASSAVCEAISREVLSNCVDAEGPFSDNDLQDAISSAYDLLDSLDSGNSPRKMGTTMTLLKFHDKGTTVAHIGDSRVYHIRPGKNGEDTRILFETRDHSLINDLIKIGEITPEEARHSKQKNVITRAMQPHTEPRCKADVKHIEDIQPGDYFYLCSDGMLEQDEMNTGEALRNIFSEEGGDPENKIRILTLATAENRDNHTAILVHVTDVIADSISEEPSTIEAVVPAESDIQETKGRKFSSRMLIIAVCALLAIFIIWVWVMPLFSSKNHSEEKGMLGKEYVETDNAEEPSELTPENFQEVSNLVEKTEKETGVEVNGNTPEKIVDNTEKISEHTEDTEEKISEEKLPKEEKKETEPSEKPDNQSI